METENRGVVETELNVINLATTGHSKLAWGITFKIIKRDIVGKVLASMLPFQDYGLYGQECDYPTMLRNIADKLEELQKEAETW